MTPADVSSEYGAGHSYEVGDAGLSDAADALARPSVTSYVSSADGAYDAS